MTADSSFSELVEVWLADLDLEGGLAPSTRALYERNMRQLVVPAFEHYALREITIGRIEPFLKALAANKSCSYAQAGEDGAQSGPWARGTLRGHHEEPGPRGQADEEATVPGGLPHHEQVEAIRVGARGWRRGPGVPGPRPDGQVEKIIEVMLGTSARIGEVLAIRKCDVDWQTVTR